MEITKIITLGFLAIIGLAMFIGFINFASKHIRKTINETLPLKRELSGNEAFAITGIILLLIIC